MSFVFLYDIQEIYSGIREKRRREKKSKLGKGLKYFKVVRREYSEKDSPTTNKHAATLNTNAQTERQHREAKGRHRHRHRQALERARCWSERRPGTPRSNGEGGMRGRGRGESEGQSNHECIHLTCVHPCA